MCHGIESSLNLTRIIDNQSTDAYFLKGKKVACWFNSNAQWINLKKQNLNNLKVGAYK